MRLRRLWDRIEWKLVEWTKLGPRRRLLERALAPSPSMVVTRVVRIYPADDQP